MEYLENYDFTLNYHPRKVNVMADALSRKSWGVLASVASQEWQMLETVGTRHDGFCDPLATYTAEA